MSVCDALFSTNLVYAGDHILPKIRSLESILQQINQLPTDIVIHIPYFLADKKGGYDYGTFPMTESLITITRL